MSTSMVPELAHISGWAQEMLHKKFYSGKLSWTRTAEALEQIAFGRVLTDPERAVEIHQVTHRGGRQ